MSIYLLLLKPEDDNMYTYLNMTRVCNGAVSDYLIGNIMADEYLTSDNIVTLAGRFAQFLTNYRLASPLFPREELLSLTELGDYWKQILLEAEALYNAGDPRFDDALDELVVTLQVDMEEEHRIPYHKHRYYDTLLCFKAEYDAAIWICVTSDELPPNLYRWEYDYLEKRSNELQNAATSGCYGRWTTKPIL